MSSAKIHRGIVVALTVSLLLALPAWAGAGAAPMPRPALQASSWDVLVNILRRSGLGGWLDLAGWGGAVSHPKNGEAAATASQDNPPGGPLSQHGTIDPNGSN
jgi:hypothetical protein